MSNSALKGIRIADFSWVWAGPHASGLLCTMGAEVIKIESHKRTDLTRVGSISTSQNFSNMDGSPLFNQVNPGKLGVTLDLSLPKGCELARKIVSISDIVLENMRPGVMDKLGLGYKDLVKVKPDIIMISSSGFGGAGPIREYTGFAPCFAAYSGLSHLTGYADGEPNNLTGSSDMRSATAAAFAMLAALTYRQRTGQGQHIDLSSSEAISVLIGDALMDYTMNKRAASRNGNHDDVMAPHNCYRCKGEDKWISIAVGTETEWRTLCKVMGNPEWTREEAFSDAYLRVKNQERLDRLMEKWTINHTHYELMELLQSAGVAAMPSFSAEEIFNDPHLKVREAIVEVEHPVIGKTALFQPPWKFSETPARIKKASPLLGEHNEYVFSHLLGMPKEEVARLIEEKVMY